MHVPLIIIAIVFLFLGHYTKAIRWGQITGVYDSADQRVLIQSLTYGYIANFFLPFRLGDLVRAFWSGRKMDNGFSFSLCTVLLDRCLDVWAVGLIFTVMYCSGSLSSTAKSTISFYIALAFLLIVLLVIATKFNVLIKKAVKFFCSIFNERIELALLIFFWAGISAFRDIPKRLNKVRLLLNTFFMWLFYLLSYYTLSLALQKYGFSTSFVDIFILLFDSKQLSRSSVMLSQSSNPKANAIMFAFILLPLLLLLVVSNLPYMIRTKLDVIAGTSSRNISALHLLPQVNPKDRLHFLEMYFDTEKQDYLNTYIQLNRDVLILGDFSAGSNATTLLCVNGANTFYRKYAFGSESEKLFSQIEWLQAHKNSIPLPIIIDVKRGSGYCCYDMLCSPGVINMFQFIHSSELLESWTLLRSALEDLDQKVHLKSIRPVDPVSLDTYINKKVLKNIEIIESSRELIPLLHFDTLIINGKPCYGFPEFKKRINKDFLVHVFSEDSCSDIHGDLTIENIICSKQGSENTYYFIDPNTGNIHNSPFLDYGKLLQSLHGNYEFLMRTPTVDIEKNKITYISTGSHCYRELFQKYALYLTEKFTPRQVRSIYFHEIVHWLRLMPYKIEQNGKRSVLFFAGMMLVFNDIVNWYEED